MRLAFHLVLAGDSFAAGDWLINYSAGFVRRGLPGELILWLSGRSPFGVPVLVCAVQAFCLLVYLGFACRLAMRARGFAAAAMILSPAAVTFELLNPPEGVRKEVLLFAVVAVLVGAGFVERMRGWVLSGAMVVVCAGLVLSHESLFVYLPYVFAALWVQRGHAAWGIAIAPAVAGVLAAVAVVGHPGDARVAAAICRSVGGVYAGLGTGLCGGSIGWLAVSLAEAHRRTVELAGMCHFGVVYGVMGALALGPVVWVGWRRELRVVWGCAAVAAAGSVGLFWSGVDWGRWIHIHVVCLLLVLLAVPRRERARSAWWGAAVGVYATCWVLPVTILSAGWQRFGVVGAVLQGFWR